MNKKRKTAAGAVPNSETIERLLDAAERLFGEHGYDGVGMRALAEAARVNLGAATYHFGSKKTLYVETFMRRFRPVNAERLRLLRAVEAQMRGRPVAVEKIVDCMVRPTYSLGLAHPDFNALLARNFAMPPAFLRVALQKEFEPNVQEFIAALRRALRDVPQDLMRLRVIFSMGPLLMFAAQIGRMPGANNPKIHERVFRELVCFVAAGLQSQPAASGPLALWPRTRR